MTNSQILGKARPFFKSNMTNEEYQIRLCNICRYLPKTPKIRTQARPINTIQTSDDYSNPWEIMVSSILQTLDRCGSDYLFSEDQVLEVLRYRPKARITYIGDCYWIVSYK